MYSVLSCQHLVLKQLFIAKTDCLNMMYPTFYIIILCIFTQCLMSVELLTCDNKCQQLSFFICQVCYQTCQTSQNISTFTMKTCQQTFCSQWSTSPPLNSNNNILSDESQCVKYQNISLSQSDCIRNCCGNPTYKQFTNDTLNQCVLVNQEKKSNSQNIAIIIIIVIASFFGIILIVTFVVICIKSKILPDIIEMISNCCAWVTNRFKKKQNGRINVQSNNDDVNREALIR